MTEATIKRGADYFSVPVSELSVGTLLRAPVYDVTEQGPLLLAAGERLTERRLDKIRSRGIADVLMHSSDLSESANRQKERPQCQDSEERASDSPFTVSRESHLHNVTMHGATRYEPDLRRELADKHEQATAEVKDLFRALATDSGVDGQTATHVATEALEEVATDLDLFLRLSIYKHNDAGVHEHGHRTARIALAIGTVMGLNRNELLELGVGCLIHDVGMQKIDSDLLARKYRLNRIEFLGVTKHPMHTYEMIEEARDIPNGARMVAYQLHERWNGGGYPRQRFGAQIHPLARIGSVADAFAAMICDRPHRGAFTAKHAITEIVRNTKAGLYDPEIARGLLNTVSLFPIGSLIEVSDGRVGIVIRSNHQDFTRPIVELWASTNFKERGEVVNLSTASELCIVRSIGVRRQ
jgi:HD-GYP domain-containing protein (c-di-GMP phosphodiesterase class II)